MKNINAPPKVGKLISIDGIDAAGKTTLAKGLSEYISGIYYKTPGKKSKEDRLYFDNHQVSVQERFNFYLSAINEDILEISQHLKEGKNVVCDRFIASTVVHHTAMDNSVNIGEIEKLNDYPGLIQILLIATKETILERLGTRGELSRFEQDESLMMKSQEIYKQRSFDLVIDTTKSSVYETLTNAILLFDNSLEYEKFLEIGGNSISKTQNYGSLGLVM